MSKFLLFWELVEDLLLDQDFLLLAVVVLVLLMLAAVAVVDLLVVQLY